MMMKYLWRKFIMASFFSLVMLGCSENDGKSDNRNESNRWNPESSLSHDIYVENTCGYRTFRIPAIVASSKGTLLAFAEGRKYSGSDTGNIDLVLRRSEDGGKTWNDLQVIWDDGDNTCGNPSPVVDPETGRIHLLMTWNHGDDTIGLINEGKGKDTRRVFYTYSDDEGRTWISPEEITSQVKKDDWGWYATGPCHGMIISDGEYCGRIVIPCDYIEIGVGRKQYSHVIWSDDKGKNWNIGGASEGGNECTVAETSDGRLLLNMRCPGNFRRLAYSSDGGMTWSKSEENRDLIDPVCQGSMLDTESGSRHVLYFSNSASLTRDHMTVKRSYDNGKTWDGRHTVYDGKTAYSDIVVIDANTLAILYENGTANPYQKISFELLKM